MYKDKQCKACTTTFVPTAPAELFCSACKEDRKVLQRLKNKLSAEKRRRKEGLRIGRGALAGALHPNYKHGYYVSQTQTNKYKQKMNCICERCAKDLTDVNRWEWVTHHIDYNHCNHDESNLELLCKSCHAKEHEVHKRLNEGATTIP